jgi:hypothetical protein
MVGSNISMRPHDHSSTTQQHSPAALLPSLPSLDSSGSAESAVGGSSRSSSESVSGVSSVIVGDAAAGGHEATLGTATVYRSKTKELEGGEAWVVGRGEGSEGGELEVEVTARGGGRRCVLGGGAS